MKIKTTESSIRKNCKPIVSVGYCALSSLLVNHEPIAYTCGVYGWNFDLYEVDGLYISTGYRRMVGPTAKQWKEYEEKADELMHDYRMTWQQRSAAVERLLADFVWINKPEGQRGHYDDPEQDPKEPAGIPVVAIGEAIRK